MYFIRGFHELSDEKILEILSLFLGQEDELLFSYHEIYFQNEEDFVKQFVKDRKKFINEAWVYPMSLFPKPEEEFTIIWFEARNMNEVKYSISLNSLFTALVHPKDSHFHNYSYVLHVFEDIDSYVLGIYDYHQSQSGNSIHEILLKIKDLSADIEIVDEQRLKWAETDEI
ncbi:hypothetical protein MKX33_20695 [Paenibacillus sp. FSL R5-0490]|uniref:hypothetical protein n=1 Tax=unclassified Paenibacillus TaxID=185978 RepID=UPI0030D1ABB2